MRRDESGVAMVIVAISTFVTLALVTVAVQSAVSSRSLSRRDQDWNASLAAAEAGIDDYLSRLNRDDSYWLYSATNPPSDGNQAFTDWVPIPGPANEGDFRYDPDTSRLVSEGVVSLTSTGRVRGTTRTVQVALRKRNFLDYLYFTDYETKDPAAYNTGFPDFDEFTPTEAQTLCERHYYGVPPRDPDCTDIYFFSRDTLNGPVHSNDAILISGTPRFMGEVTTSWDDPSGRRWRGSGNPSFARPGDPELVSPLTLPPSNTAIRTEADAALGGTGCLYTGPTSIVLNPNGTMDVDSDFTLPGSGNCSTGLGVALPPNGVIYVQNVPAGHPNAGCTTHPLGYPITNDITNYSCRDGDVFLEGTLNGRLTIAAEHDITVVWHVTYAGGLAGDDILGLVANNYVQVYHPVRCTSTDGDGNCTNGVNLAVRPPPNQFFRDPQIHAAILSVQHSFRVQNYRFGGALGLLGVRGAIAQKFRGIVGTFAGGNPNSGYEKDYVYDQRLRYQSPPHFLDPVSSSWQVANWAEEPPAYLA
ncbi:MAG: pilus assembly PilX N-terminal domain-containing protein [Actinomycetota bacterium]